MKNTIKFLSYIFITIMLSSCFFNSAQDDEINKAKEEMWISQTENNDSPIDEIEDTTEWNWVWNNVDKKEENIKIESLTDEVFLEFDDLSWVNLLWWEVEITWKTLVTVDKITVEFTNNSSSYPNDNYTLQKFQTWDETFIYRAFSNFETLDFWTNEYIFSAYSGDDIAKTKITLIVEEESKDETTEVVWEFDFDNLPIWENFWEPREIWDWKITYSDIKGLNIEMLAKNNYDCWQNPETEEYYVTEILNNKLDSYYWWNTCRPFWDNEWISFYVLRLEWTSYVYEKHIFLNNWIYWIYNIDSQENFVDDNEDNWSILTKLQEKNNELKELNETFTVIEVVNDLFTKILDNQN